MKYGHTEAHLPGSNPNTWRWRVREAMETNPEVVVVIGAGGVLLICIGAVLFVVFDRWERHHH